MYTQYEYQYTKYKAQEFKTWNNIYFMSQLKISIFKKYIYTYMYLCVLYLIVHALEKAKWHAQTFKSHLYCIWKCLRHSW